MRETYRKAETQDNERGKWKENYTDSDRGGETQKGRNSEKEINRTLQV